MRLQTFLITLFLIFATSAMAIDKIEVAIISGAAKGEFIAAMQCCPKEHFNRWENEAGETYLHLMARYNRAEQVHWMMEFFPGAQRQLIMGDKWVRTSLERAVEAGHVEAFKALYHYWDERYLATGGFTRYWRAGFTLYHVAAYFNQPGIVQALHAFKGVRGEEGGGLSVRNSAGETPLDVAIRRGAKEAIAALERLGALPGTALPALPRWQKTSPVFDLIQEADEPEVLARADAAVMVPAPDTMETVKVFLQTSVLSGLSKLF